MTQIAGQIEPRPVRRHVLGMAVSLGISGAILALLWFYKGIDAAALEAAWAGADKTVLIGAVVFSAAVHIFVGAHKLWRILLALGVDIGYGEALRIRLGAGPLRILVPLKAGEMVNVLYFWRHKRMPFGRAAGAGILDKGLNLVGAAFLLLLGIALLPSVQTAWRILLVAGVCAFFLLLFFCVPMHNLAIRVARRLHPKLGRLAEGVLAPFREFSPGRKLYFLVYGIVFNLRPLIVCFLLLYAYGAYVHGAEVTARASVAVLAGHTPGTMVGMGPREWAIARFFRSFASKEVLFSVGFLMTVTVQVIPMLCGIPWAPWFLRRLARPGRAAPQPGVPR